jgi:hypothetical protein
MEPTYPIVANFRNRIAKRLGESAKDRLGLTKREYTSWLEERLRRASTIEAALEEAIQILEDRSRRS